MPHGCPLRPQQPGGHPQRDTLPIVRNHLDHLKRSGPAGAKPSCTSLETRMGVRLLVDALQRLPPNATPADLSRAPENIRRHDLGGIFVRFSKNDHVGPAHVDLTVR